jgi:hypothetical protein
MDAKKIIGLGVLVAIVGALGVVIIKQMSTVTRPATSMTTTTVPQNEPAAKKGLTEEAQLSVPDTQQPTTVDAIVGDIDSEMVSDDAAVTDEATGEAAVMEEESGSLNDVSEFYDDKNL